LNTDPRLEGTNPHDLLPVHYNPANSTFFSVNGERIDTASRVWCIDGKLYVSPRKEIMAFAEEYNI
jgi:hypothetical protein